MPPIEVGAKEVWAAEAEAKASNELRAEKETVIEASTNGLLRSNTECSHKSLKMC